MIIKLRCPLKLAVLLHAESFDVSHVLRDRDLVLLLDNHPELLRLITATDNDANLCSFRERVLSGVSVNRAD